MASVLWTVGAREDLRQLIAFVGQDSETYAAIVVGRIMAAVSRLESYPLIGRIVPEYQDATIREVLVGNYRIVYRIRQEVIGVIAVVHRGREMLRAVGDDPWDFA